MPAYQIRVEGTLDGVTPLSIPSSMPSPSAGVIRLVAHANVGTIDLGQLLANHGASMWIRGFHVEYANGTRAARHDLIMPGSLVPEPLGPIVASSSGPLLMRPIIFSPRTVAPVGTSLEILTDNVGPTFGGAPVAGPHFIYIDLVPLIGAELPAVSVMAADAALKLDAQSEIYTSVQAVAATSSELVGLWRSPIQDRLGSSTPAGQLVSAQVAVGDAAAAGESMQVQVSAQFGGVSTLLGLVTIDDTVAANTVVDLPIALPNNELRSGSALQVTRLYAAGMAPAPMTNTVVRLKVAPVAAGAIVGGDVPPLMATFTMPPISRLSSEESMRDQGLMGLNFTGHRILLGATHYVWFGDDSGVGGSFNPGTVDPALVGRVGIRVGIPAGNQSDVNVANLVAVAIAAEGTYGAIAIGAQVQVTGTSTVAAGAVSSTTGSYGLRGSQYSRALIGGAYFDSAQLRGCRLDPARLPAAPFVVTGMRYVNGDVHTAQVPMALYQGGAGPGDFAGADFLGVVGVSSGAATDAVVFAPCPAPFLVDPGAGDLWVMWMHDPGGVTMPFAGVGSGGQTTSDYALSGGQGIFISAAGPSSSNPADFPAVAPAIGGGTFASVPSFALSFVEAAAMPCNMVPRYRMGTRQSNPALFPSTSNDPLFVGDSYTNPPVLGCSIVRMFVAYDTHVLDSNYRCSYSEGGLDVETFTGAVNFDIGQAGAGGTATGWVGVEPPAPIPMTPGVQSWLNLHFDASGSVLRFVDDLVPPNTYSPPENPAAFINDGNTGFTNASECEVDDGTLGGVPTTNYVLDPNLPQVSPLPVPDGTIYRNDNFVGVYAECDVLGWAA